MGIHYLTMDISHTYMDNGYHMFNRQRRTQGGGRGPGPPWDLKNNIFSGFLPLNYVICIFEVSFLNIFAMWEV